MSLRPRRYPASEQPKPCFSRFTAAVAASGATQDQLRFFYWLRVGGGVGFLLGLLTYLYSFFAAPGSAEDEAAVSPGLMPLRAA